MAKRPRTAYCYNKLVQPGTPDFYFQARITGHGIFRIYGMSTAVIQAYRGKEELVGNLHGRPMSFDDFVLQFNAWWTAISPWMTIAYDIVIYDRLGRSLGTATEYGPILARKRAKELLATVNGTAAVILSRNKKTLKVTQVATLRRRATRAV